MTYPPGPCPFLASERSYRQHLRLFGFSLLANPHLAGHGKIKHIIIIQKKEPLLWFLFFVTGNDLSSRAVSSQVLSALKGLTSVFGMRTGGSPSPLSPVSLNVLLHTHNCIVSILSWKTIWPSTNLTTCEQASTY